MKDINELIKHLESRLSHSNLRVTTLKPPTPQDEMKLTYHGGWTVGYWEGRVSVISDVLDELKDILNKNKT